MISKNSIFWFGSVLIALLALFIFIFIPVEQRHIGEPAATRIYYADNISLAHQAVIDRFNKLNEGAIEVVPVNLPFSKFSTNERKEILARALRSRSERLDVFSVDLIWVARFARWGYPLDLYFDKDKLVHLNSEAMKSCYSGNRLVSIPLYLDIGLMYYRPDLLQALPDFNELKKKLRNSITWPEFIALGRRIKGSGKPFYIFPGNNYEGLICSFYELLDEKDEQLMFMNQSVQLYNSGARSALKQMVDMIHAEGLTPENVTAFDEYKSYLYALNHDAVFLRGWPGFLKQYKGVVPDSAKLALYEITALPHPEGENSTGVFGGWNLMVSRFSGKKRQAIKFISFTLEKENQELLYELGGYIPVVESVYNDTTFLEKYPELRYYRDLLKTGKHRPYRADYTKISDIVSYYIKMALKQNISVDRALISATDEINSRRLFVK